MHNTDSLSILRNSFLSIAKVKDAQKGYITAVPFNISLDPDLLSLVSRSWAEHYVDYPRIDAIVGLPDAGSRLVSIVADMLRIRKILPSKRTKIAPSSWESVVKFSNKSFTTGQDDIVSQIGFLQPGMRLLIVDDVVAHGSTAVAAIKALQDYGVEIVGLAVIFDKKWQGGVEKIEKETGVPVFSLISIESISEEGKIILDN
ncbi:MAG: phosphoribosyltransferase family protein [Candidatus Pacebacteria bacterium]|nr:phosphoribosyltransferase family protein [Candidatus Paceibacterota bacterium]